MYKLYTNMRGFIFFCNFVSSKPEHKTLAFLSIIFQQSNQNFDVFMLKFMKFL